MENHIVTTDMESGLIINNDKNIANTDIMLNKSVLVENNDNNIANTDILSNQTASITNVSKLINTNITESSNVLTKQTLFMEKDDLNVKYTTTNVPFNKNSYLTKNYIQPSLSKFIGKTSFMCSNLWNIIINFKFISQTGLYYLIPFLLCVCSLNPELAIYIFALCVNIICASSLMLGLFPLYKLKIISKLTYTIPNKFKKSKLNRKCKSSKTRFKPAHFSGPLKRIYSNLIKAPKNSKDYIKQVDHRTGLEPYIFEIYHNNTKLLFEIDSGAGSNLVSREYLEHLIPNYKEYFYKKAKNTLQSVTGHDIKCYGLFRIPFYLPNYGDIVLDVLVTDNVIDNCFLLGRDFIKAACVTIVYDDSINSARLEYNRKLAPKVKVNDHLTFLPFEQKLIVGKIVNNKQNTSYEIKNSFSSPLLYKQTFKENNDIYITATNKLNIPVSHKISSITLIEKQKQLCNNNNKNNAIFIFEKIISKNCFNSIFPLLAYLYTQFWIALINIKFTLDDIMTILPLNFISKQMLLFLNKTILLNNLISHILVLYTDKYTTINKIDKTIKKEVKPSPNVIDENEFFQSFQNDLDIGLNISDVLETKLSTVQDIKDSITCQFEKVKSRIANLIYDLQVYSKHTFDCGSLNESFIPKMSVKLSSPVYRNTKPYSLKATDREAVDKFFDLLLQNGYAEIAPPHMSFGNPVFTVPSRSEDKSELPRIIIDAKYSNEAAFGGTSAALPDYKNLLSPIIKKSKYITTIDLKKCFYSIQVDKESMDSGAMNVLTEKAAYIMKRALTGFCQTPSYLVQTMQKYLHLDKNGQLDFIQNLLIFMDDIILYSESEEELQNHILEIEKLLNRLHLIGVKISTSKCTLAFDLDSSDEIHILGYKIKNRKILCPDKKLNEITTLGEPDSLKKMQSLLGKINYYRSIFPLSVHEQCNLLYKKLNPFIYDSEAKLAFSKIKELLSKTERFIDVPSENSVNVLLTDASHYSIGSVLLNVNMSECVKKFPINSHKIDPNIIHPYPKDTEYICLNENIIESIFKTARKLNHRSFPEDFTSAMTHLYTILNLYDYDFVEFMPYTNKKECLSTLHKEVFCKTIQQLNTDFLINNDHILYYLLYGCTKMFKTNIVFSTPCSTIKIGNYSEDICFLLHDSLIYGLNVKTPNILCKKTVLRFGPNLMTLSEFKDYFINIIKNNTYEMNKHLVKIVSFYSKAIPLGCLEKQGIAYLEIFSVYASLRYYEPQITNKCTYLLLDSMVVKGVLTRHKFSSRNVKIDNLANKLYFWYKGTALYFIHVTDKQNLADVWSRLCPIEISTFNNSVKPYYTDDYLTISEFPILGNNSNEKEGYSVKKVHTKFPNVGKYFSDKFKEYLSTPNFIKLQLAEKNCPDSLPHTIKFIDGKILLPQILYLPYICFIHYSLMHMGNQRLWNYVNNYYYFNNRKLAKLICDNLTANCLLCIQNKPNSLRLKEGSTFNNSINSPNKLIYSDLLELPTFENKVRKQDPKALLIIKDVYSTYTSIYILQSKTSRAIMNCLSNYFSVHDIPASFISDNASIYKSKLIMSYFNNLNIKVLNSSILKSKSRGFIERAVRTTNEMLRIYREKYTTLDLSHILSISCAMLNKIPFLNEKLSPYNIQFNSLDGIMDGEFKDPTENVFQYVLNDNLNLYSEQYKLEVQQLIKDCRDRVVQYKMRNSDKKNKNRIDHSFHINDIVFTKLNDKSYGFKYKPLFGLVPYKVVDRSDQTIHIQNQISGQVVMRHASDLKKVNFNKLSKLDIDKSLAEAFKLLSYDNINELFNIPVLKPRNLDKNKNQDIQEPNYLDSSSSEDELYSNENHDLDNNENSINDLETILEE